MRLGDIADDPVVTEAVNTAIGTTAPGTTPQQQAMSQGQDPQQQAMSQGQDPQQQQPVSIDDQIKAKQEEINNTKQQIQMLEKELNLLRQQQAQSRT